MASFPWGRGSDSSAGWEGGRHCRAAERRGAAHCGPCFVIESPHGCCPSLQGPAAHPVAYPTPCGESRLLSWALSRTPGPATQSSIQEGYGHLAKTGPLAQTTAADSVRGLAWRRHRCRAGLVLPPRAPATFRKPGAWLCNSP